MANLTAPFDVAEKQGEEIRIQAAAVKNYHGGAASVILGTGYARPLVVATANSQFIGVYLETSDNSNGTPGTIVYGAPLSGYAPFVRVARKGIFAFHQTGILQASVGALAYFSDDNTVTTTPGAIIAGMIVAVDEQNSLAWVDISNAVMPIPTLRTGLTIQAGDGAIPPHANGTFVITKGTAAALTLAAPTATTDDGVTITLTSNTAAAHVLTATGLLQDGSTTTDVATFAAHPGASLTLMAYQGKWNVISQVGITFT